MVAEQVVKVRCEGTTSLASLRGWRRKAGVVEADLVLPIAISRRAMCDPRVRFCELGDEGAYSSGGVSPARERRRGCANARVR